MTSPRLRSRARRASPGHCISVKKTTNGRCARLPRISSDRRSARADHHVPEPRHVKARRIAQPSRTCTPPVADGHISTSIRKLNPARTPRLNFYHQGQVCAAGTRVLVHESLVDRVVEGLVQTAANARIGDPFLPTSTMGSIVNQRQLDQILRYIDIGREEGAELVTGGARNWRPHWPPIRGTATLDPSAAVNIEGSGWSNPIVPIALKWHRSKTYAAWDPCHATTSSGEWS
ncbi:aldehyde dehydrogenase family protein [Nocardia gamkensis]|uniref:aldehyde dehydrogenase family protein n=1 Tax=Nocardia gamkensis TaxID=352869 RepID=UPI0037CC1383